MSELYTHFAYIIYNVNLSHAKHGVRNNNSWIFHAVEENKDGKKKIYRDLLMARQIRIIRHVKIRTKANPYDPDWTEYFVNRKSIRRNSTRDSCLIEELGWQ